MNRTKVSESVFKYVCPYCHAEVKRGQEPQKSVSTKDDENSTN